MANVSEEDMTEITDAIMVFDREGDNKLAVEDITRCLRALGMNPGSTEWDDVMADFKKQGVSRIDAKEFAAIYEEESKKKRATFQELVEGLKGMDPNGAKLGVVNATTLKRYMSVMGDAVTDNQADILITPSLDKKGTNVVIDDIVKLVMGLEK